MSDVRVLLTDLDDTLFDHHRATRMALAALQDREPRLTRVTLDELERRHRELLEVFHLEVLAGRLSIEDARVRRFQQLMADVDGSLDPGAAVAAARTYRDAYEESWHPLPGASELLRLMTVEGVAVVVVTNNIVAEQQQKLERIGLTRYVDALVTSEETGFCKPEPAIFEYALSRAGVPAREAVMLGDAWSADIEGARRVGLRAVWLNRFGLTSPDPSVPELRTLDPAREAFDLLRGAFVG